MNTLKGLTVLVTRPRPHGEILCEKIRQAGGRAIYFPTIEFSPPQDEKAFQQSIATLDQFDWIIFISPQAVYQSVPLIQRNWPEFPSQINVAATGEGTANALKMAGLPVSVYPQEDWRSEGLLALAAFQQVQGKKIAIIRGEGGRPYLADQLMLRGAKVSHIIAYRRDLPKVELTGYIDLLQTQQIDIIVCTSVEILQNLQHLFGTDYWNELRHLPLVVISERMVSFAHEMQFETVFLAKNASHNAIMDFLEGYMNYDR